MSENSTKILAALFWPVGVFCMTNAPNISENLAIASIHLPEWGVGLVIVLGFVVTMVSALFWLFTLFSWLKDNWRYRMGPILLGAMGISMLVGASIWWQKIQPEQNVLIISEVFQPHRGTVDFSKVKLSVTNTLPSTAQDVKLKIEKIKLNKSSGHTYIEPNVALPLLSGSGEKTSISKNDKEDYLLANYGFEKMTPEDREKYPHKIGYDYLVFANFDGVVLREGQEATISIRASASNIDDSFVQNFTISIPEGGGLRGPAKVGNVAWGIE